MPTEQLIVDPKPKKKYCAGMVFRCVNSQFMYRDDHKRLIWSERTIMRLLKKESCPGCEQCGYMEDNLHEFQLKEMLRYVLI